MALSKWRGWDIVYRDRWVYLDTGEPVAGNERPCGFCLKENTEEGHDGCLGTLPGVMNACCGHGETDKAYVQFSDNRIIEGEEAIEFTAKDGGEDAS